MEDLEKTKEEIRSYIETYVKVISSNLNESQNEFMKENLRSFYIAKAIEVLGLDWFINTLLNEIFEKYKDKDRQLTANMTALANLIFHSHTLNELL